MRVAIEYIPHVDRLSFPVLKTTGVLRTRVLRTQPPNGFIVAWKIAVERKPRSGSPTRAPSCTFPPRHVRTFDPSPRLLPDDGAASPKPRLWLRDPADPPGARTPRIE